MRTFREHYDLYFNKAKNEWEKIEFSDDESGSQTKADSNTRNTRGGHESDGDHDQDETRLQPGTCVHLLCVKTKGVPSVLHSAREDHKNLTSFTWMQLLNEMKNRAPDVREFLTTIALPMLCVLPMVF